jgi:ABC transport system ATP-binding/permease protein
MSLIRIQDGSLAFGHVALLDQVELNVENRERVCLIGRNGTGKSTLLNVLAGELQLDSGQVWRRDGLRIARLAQEVPGSADASLFEVVAAGLGNNSDLLARYHHASAALAEQGEKVTQAQLEAFGRLQAELESAGGWEGSQKVDAVLSRLDLPPDASMSQCSGGVRRRAMLGQALVSEPDLLLLDEPTNHLDIEAIEALEEALLGYQGAVVFITHDRSLIDHLATRIIELDRGTLRSFPGSYAAYLQRKAALLDAEADANRKFDKDLAAEEVWIRQGIKARRTRNEGRVRRLEAMRRERSERRGRQGNARMALERGEQSGKLVIEAENVSFGFDDELIVRDFSTLISRGDRIGIIGRNGTGKTTLLRLLLGDLQPTSGTIRRGTALNIGYFDQERMQLDEDRSVRDNLAQGSDQIEIGGKSRHVISYLADFLFAPARAQSPVKTLSGGERNRLLLAKLFAQPTNLLVLDEPTNDLDVETLELLEELLGDYQGTLLLVSHDRSFIDRTVTSTLWLSGDGNVEEHVGGYSDWQRYRALHVDKPAREQGAKKPSPAASTPGQTRTDTRPEAVKPKRLSYKEQRELDALPDLIETLETQQQTLHARTADPAFYRSEPDAIAATLAQLSEIEEQLAAAYARWEAMEAAKAP